MYAFRKPFTAGTFEQLTLWGVGYKTVLVASQVFGYTLSKFIGIKVISEMPSSRRAVAIVLLIGLAEASLFFFGLVPPPYNFFFLFVNGLPLGLVFGLVLSYLEGRRLTEALAAGLCASFIVSSGCVKSVGRLLIVHYGVSEFWMPFLTGLIFIGPLLVSVWLLSQIPAPRISDVQHRGVRQPMSAADRRQVFVTYGFGLSMVVTAYILLTVMRSIRDDFAVEIWRDLGEDGKPAIFAQSELLVMFGVVTINAAAIVIRCNRLALQFAVTTMITGFAVVLLAVLAYRHHWLSAFPFMVLLGLGMYVPYVAIHTTIFERMIAAFRTVGNIGYLMYLADALGYLGYVGVMLMKNAGGDRANFLDFFLSASTLMAILCIGLMFCSLLYFRRKLPQPAPVPLASST
jgi:hypothetical protein